MNYFVFQVLMDYLDGHGGFAAVAGRPWLATRYRSLMKPGDLVYFWIGGDAAVRGVHGWGEIASLPYIPTGRQRYRIDVVVKAMLREPVPVAAIKSNDRLSGMHILSFPVGANFRIGEDEARALAEMIPPDERPVLPMRAPALADGN